MTIKNIADDVISRKRPGEVDWRPPPRVKDLIENAIDAGANEISIQGKIPVKSWSKSAITVAEYNAEDLRKCVQRHATSKLRTQKITSIITLWDSRRALQQLGPFPEWRYAHDWIRICDCGKNYGGWR
jgi:DNA mismatch repair protein MutL